MNDEAKTKKQLITELEELRQIISDSNEAILVAQDGLFKFVNPKTSEITGYSEEELISQPFTKAIHPDDRELVLERHQKRLKGELAPVGTYNFRIVTKSGNTKWIELKTALCAWEGRNATVNFLRDISERKKIEEALVESEEKYRLFFQSERDAALVFDEEGWIIDVNPAWEKLYGYSKEEALKMKAIDISAEQENTMAAISKAYIEGTAYIPVRWHRKKDGTVFQVEIAASVLAWKGRRLMNVRAGDITERKRTEELLIKSEELYRQLVETMNEGLCIIDAEFRAVFANRRYCEMIGYSIDEIIGQPVGNFFNEENKKILKEQFERRKRGQKGAYEIAFTRKDGELVHTLLSPAPLFDNGKLKGSIGVITDITGRKLAEEAIKRYSQNLERLLLVSSEITTTTDLKKLYRNVITYSKDFLKLDFSTLMILSEDKTHITLQDTIGFSESMIGTFSLVEGQGLSTYVVKNKAAGTVTDFGTETRFEVPPVVFEKKITSAVCVPMILEGEVFGVLVGHTIAKREFTEQEISLYQNVANQAAIAIKNSMNINALKEYAERIRTLTENVPVGINISAPEGRIIEANPAMRRMFGYGSIEEFLKLPASELYCDPEDRKRFIELHNAKGMVKDFEVRLKRKDGSAFWGSIRSIAQASSGGTRLFNVIEDITERKQAEETLKRHSEELEKSVGDRTKDLELTNMELKKIFNAIEQTADAVAITDINGTIQYINPAFSVITGYSREEVIGQNPRILKSGKNPPEMYTNLWNTILAGNIWKGTTINKKKSGELYYMEMTITPVIDEQGKIRNFVSIQNDVTDRVKAEEELRQKSIELEAAKDMAEAANRAKSDFLANMSHELRTPLNSIIGFSEVLKDGMAGPLTEDQKEFANDIHESGHHLLSIISDILDLSRIEAGKEELELAESPLEVLLTESLMMFKEKALKHNIRLTAEIQRDIGYIMIDARKVKQVVINLLSNAMKFTPDGSEVSLQARRVKSSEIGVGSPERERVCAELITQHSGLATDFIEVSVEDTGIGIKEEDMQRLFRPFEQLEKHLTKQYPGTGLGLALCKKFVEMHNGRIWAESEPGKGTRFRFIIPARGTDGSKKSTNS